MKRMNRYNHHICQENAIYELQRGIAATKFHEILARFDFPSFSPMTCSDSSSGNENNLRIKTSSGLEVHAWGPSYLGCAGRKMAV
jgi:hypothetical protein